ncbi:hypothetical protein Zmor_014391 [Zophobas morio]|uniref:Uncharacterized protein n=1 Tax=Zophobas morio TaxID=2755281 RepID=A0AA38IFW4_9CUCU|nr:hypothetical protein Zmor_014391 [Zophobas morio]
MNFSYSECVDMVMLYGVLEHQWYSISEIMVPSTFNSPKEYCKLKNKFWNSAKKSPTSVLVDLQPKLEPADFPHRVIYCVWLLQHCSECPNFLKCILFTD